MQPKSTQSHADLFRSQLSQILDPKNPLLILAEKIDWSRFDSEINACYAKEIGRPGINTRVMVGLLYLKEAFNQSDESLMNLWVENPYWQAFCGFQYMQHNAPIDPSSLSRWRNRVGAERFELLLKVVIETALKMKALKPDDLKKINVDTTVQQKAIAFPTDSRLYQKMRLVLVRRAKHLNIVLKETFQKAGKEALIMHSRYSHAKQYKRATKMEKRLKTLLGRMIRIIQKLAPHQDGKIKDDKLRQLLELAERLMAQEKTSKNKIYSVHEPEVKCISKGKAHKRYEFGCKVSVVTTNKSNWVVGIQALDGNPFDGHTLQRSVTHMERITGRSPEHVVIDQGYKGHDYSGPAQVHIVKKLSKSIEKSIRNMMKRRAAIEPVIGHLKSDHRMERNYLRGVEGDRNNAILAGIGFNLRKLLRWVIFTLNFWLTECLTVIKSRFWSSIEVDLLRI